MRFRWNFRGVTHCIKSYFKDDRRNKLSSLPSRKSQGVFEIVIYSAERNRFISA